MGDTELSTALHEVILSISSQHTLDSVIRETVRGSRALTGAGAAAVALADECGGWREVASDGIPEHLLEFARDGNGRETPDGLLAVPLLARGRRLGAIVAGAPANGGFRSRDRRVLDMVAAHAAIAIDNAEVLEQQEAELRAAAVSALRERRRLEDVVRVLPIGIAILDRDLRYRFCNETYAAFHGLPSCDLTNRSARDIHPVATKALEEDLAAAMAGRPRRLPEVPYHLPDEPDDAPFRYLDLELLPLPGEGESEGIVAITLDCSRSVESRRRLQELALLAGTRAAEFGGVLENLADPILVVDDKGNTKFTNSAMDRLAREAGIRTHKGLARSLAARLHLPDGRQVRAETAPLARALRGDHVRGEESLLLLPDGTRSWLSTDARPYYDQQGALLGAVSITRDISAEKKHERLRDEFLTLVAHQLRTPLTVIYGVARKLTQEENAVSGDLQDSLMLDIYEEAQRLKELIEDLLLLAQAQTRLEYRAEPLRADVALAEVVDECRRYTPRRTVELQLGPDLPIVMADRSLLTQIMRTLLTNAGKYSPFGSGIDVLVRDDGRMLRVSVLDRGFGLGDEDPELLFEPFYRGRQALAQQGTGLGLTIARGLVELQGGAMWAERREGGGSAFSFTLPVVTPVSD